MQHQSGQGILSQRAMLRSVYRSHQPPLLPPTLLQYGEVSRDHEQKTRGAGSWWRVGQPLVHVQIPGSAARHDGGRGETIEIVSTVTENETKTTYASCMSEHYKWQVRPSSRLMLGTDNDSFVHEYSYEIP